MGLDNTDERIAAVRFDLSPNALGCLQAVARTTEDQDAMIASDLQAGWLNPDSLLEKCLVGAEGDDVIAGWTEYVGTVSRIGRVAQGRCTVADVAQ